MVDIILISLLITAGGWTSLWLVNLTDFSDENDRAKEFEQIFEDKNLQRSEVEDFAEPIQQESKINYNANGIYDTDHYWISTEEIQGNHLIEELGEDEEFAFSEELENEPLKHEPLKHETPKQEIVSTSPIFFEREAIAVLKELSASNNQLEDMKVFFSTVQSHHFETANRDFQLLLEGYCELNAMERETMQPFFLKGLNALFLTFENLRNEVIEKSRHKLKHRVAVIESRATT